MIYLKNKFGNIYANLIDKKGAHLNLTRDHIIHNETHYSNNHIDFAYST